MSMLYKWEEVASLAAPSERRYGGLRLQPDIKVK